MELKVNGTLRQVAVDGGTPLLWVLREDLQLTGTKFGCGEGSCGVCNVLVDGVLTHSCTLPVSEAAGTEILTIEGLSQGPLRRLQDAWLELDVSQCGYCQPGQLMAAAALLRQHAQPTDGEIDAAMGVLCRCGTYNRIRAAIHRAAKVEK